MVLVSAAALVGAVRLSATQEEGPVFPSGAADSPLEATPGNGEKTETAEVRARSDWFYKQRAYPGTETPDGARARAMAQARGIKEAGPPPRPLGAPAAPTTSAGSETSGGAVPAAPTAALTWTSVGPAPIGERIAGTDYWQGAYPLAGRVTAIATHPTLADTAYIGAADGGVWKTTNGGATWLPKFDGQASLSIGALAVAPDGTVWVGTGEANESGDAYFGAGIFKSTDGGTIWAKSGTFDGCHVADIRVDPNNSSRVIAAVHRYGRYTTSCADGLYRTIDGGTTWSLLTVAGLGHYGSGAPHEPTSVAVGNASGTTTWYAGVWIDGVYKSVNGGDTWTLVKSAVGAGRVSVATKRNDPLRVSAVIGNNSSGQLLGIYNSLDGGTGWSAGLPLALSTDGAAVGLSFCSSQCWYDLTSAIADDGTLYAGGLTDWKQTGSSMTDIGFKTNGSGIHVDQHALAFDASGRLWVGSDGGVYRTSDGGTTFTNLNASLAINQIEPGISGSLGGTFVAGSQDTGTNRYTGSASWTQIFGGDGGASAVVPGPAAGPSDDTIYASYIYGEVRKSTNGGVGPWTDITAVPRASGDGVQFYPPFAMAPSDSNRLYLGMTRLWRSTTGAAPFSAISPQFGTSQSDYWGQVTAIGLTPLNTDTIYVGTAGHGIQKTTNATAPTPTWGAFTTGLPNRTVTDIEIKPTDSQVAFTSVSSFNQYTPAGHVFLTTNGGTSWANVSGNLPDSPVNTLAIDWATSPATIYAGTDVGVFWSQDGGTSWANTSANLPTVVIMDLKLDTAANRLIAGTHGRGVWSAPLPTVAAPVPTVTSFVPTTGPNGATVTITGTNFTGATQVSLFFVPTTFTVVNPTTITAQVPADVPGPGRWRVTTPAGTGLGSDLFTPTGPSVSGYTPASGANGSTVTITGTNFSLASQVTLYFVNATFTVVNSTTITAQVPADVPGPGRWRVTTPYGLGTSATQFISTGPYVSGYTPASGPSGTTVTITGSNFTGATQVTLYFVNATFTVVNSTTITAQVPADVPGPGRWRVTTPNGLGTSVTQFIPTAPYVSGYTPASGPSGTTVTITGSNFTGATQVTLYFVNATFTVVNSTTITAQVPADVPGPGRWRVTSPNGLGTSATQFIPTSPAVTGFTPTSGAVASTVTITGINFTGATQVSLYFISTTFTVVNSTTITAQVPAGAPAPGRWRVITPLGTGTGANLFTTTP